MSGARATHRRSFSLLHRARPGRAHPPVVAGARGAAAAGAPVAVARVFRHHQGFATSQLRAFESTQTAAAKNVPYVLRTTLTGAHLLRTAGFVTDVPQCPRRVRLRAARASSRHQALRRARAAP